MDCSERTGPISNGIINKIELVKQLWNEYHYFYTVNELDIPQNCLYTSAVKLIDAEIEYLNSLKNDLENFN
jgi:hypothetical protein